MSRISSFTAASIRSLYSPESNDSIMLSLEIVSGSYTEAIRIIDNFTHRFEFLNGTQYTKTDVMTQVSTTGTFSANDSIVKSILIDNPDEYFYGCISNGNIYLFVPFEITLPTDEIGTVPSCKVVIHDVTQYVIPIVREIVEPPVVSVRLMMYSDPNTFPLEMDGFLMSAITYTADEVTFDLTVESYISEPFPAHSFTPSIFPGIF